MKKFLFVLIFLLILGGALFFLGWAQFTVPPGSYGVMRTKTHGLDPHVIRAGEFRWVWYKLLPTNTEISVFTIGPVKRSIRSSGVLSSGQVYAALAGLEADFSWEISGELVFNVNPAYLPKLSERENISDDEGLRKAEENLAVKLENLVLEQLKAYASGDNDEKIESIIFGRTLPELNRDIEMQMPEIENFNCTIQALRLPDYTLYQSVRAIYQEYIARQNAIISQDVEQEADKRVNSRFRLEELSQYGELLTKYPILLDFLSVEQGINNSLNND